MKTAPLSFTINTACATFHHWLLAYFGRQKLRPSDRCLSWYVEETAGGGYSVTVGRFTDRIVGLEGKTPPQEALASPEAYAHWCFWNDIGNAWDGIELVLLPLAAERTEVIIHYWPPEQVLTLLLDDIAERWPECREQLAAHLHPRTPSPAPGEAGAHVEPPHAQEQPPRAPRVPKRPKDRARWRAIWLLAKGEWQKGRSYREMSDWLHRRPSGPKCSHETLADILRAGEAGLLDP